MADSVELVADPTSSWDTIGASDPSGVADCPVGMYCADGLAATCPAGTFCAVPALTASRKCGPGSYQSDAGASRCELCPAGTFCFYSGQASPYKCKPGFTCRHEGSASPNRPCPAGSYCPSAIAADVSNSTMQPERHPRLCRQGNYCLWGVYTAEVDGDNPQAAQVCRGGRYCAEGSATPDGKGKCRPGHYCPASTAEMLEAPPGSHAEGTGNSVPEPCGKGFYQEEAGKFQCDRCKKGHECPEEGLVYAKRCR